MKLQIGDPFLLQNNLGYSFGVVLAINEKKGTALVTFQNRDFRDCELPIYYIEANLMKEGEEN